jgi:hypothetical protein
MRKVDSPLEDAYCEGISFENAIIAVGATGNANRID